uniref:U4/U6 small nuclear ribonucleoprotein PRP4-like protein n=1 Tax=Anthurium amnicola TaxID=1678845 RepID=A0A1D1XK98_9ARAE
MEEEPHAADGTPPPAPATITPPIAPIPLPPPTLAAIPRPPPAATPAPADGSESDREGSSPPPHSSAAADEYEISEESRAVRERQEKARQELLLKRKAYAMAVPTNPEAVRARLRRLGEPVTLFGEREMERRDRLRAIMVRLDAEGQLERLLRAHDEEEQAAEAAAAEAGEGEEGPIKYPFFTVGSQELLQARVDIAKYSLARAAGRLDRARRRREDPDEDPDAEAELVLQQATGFALDCSEIGDDRPLTGCSFSYDGSLLATRSSLPHRIPSIWKIPRNCQF